MAQIYIGEYADIGSTSRGSVPIPLDPPLKEQTVGIGSQSRQSAVLLSTTCIVKLINDADCAIAIGDDPDATNSVRRLAPGEHIIAVPPNSKLKIAVVASGSGPMSDSLGAFLKIIASPDEAQKRLDDLSRQSADIDASLQALRAATDANKQAKADADAAAKIAADATAASEEAAAGIEKQRNQLAAETEAYAAKVKDDGLAAASRENNIADRETAISSAAAALNSKGTKLTDAAAALDAREAALTDRETAAAALKADYEARITKLKALTG